MLDGCYDTKMQDSEDAESSTENVQRENERIRESGGKREKESLRRHGYFCCVF